jgi:hypothetical protein
MKESYYQEKGFCNAPAHAIKNDDDKESTAKEGQLSCVFAGRTSGALYPIA